MSIRATNWAWIQPIAPTGTKLVLLKLADHADEAGYCFPSIALIAQRCVIDERTVQRHLRRLAATGYLRIKPRFQGDRCSSNAYHLPLSDRTGGNLPPFAATPAPHPTELPPSPVSLGSPIPPAILSAGGDTPATLTSIEPSSETTTTNHHAGDLVGAGRVGLFTGIPSAMRDDARQRLSGLPSDLAQLVADEWTAHLRLGTIRKPTAYLITLIRLASTGQFVPKLADRERQRRLADQERLSHHHAKPTPI